MRRPALATLPLLLGVLGCEGEPILLLVDARTDFEPGTEFSSVRTELASVEPGDVSSDAIFGSRPFDTVIADAEATADYVRGVRIAELEVASSGDYLLRVTLLSPAGAPLVSRLVRLRIERALATTVVLTRTCAGVSCPGPGDDPNETTCADGRCVSPACDPETGECPSPTPDAGERDAGPPRDAASPPDASPPPPDGGPPPCACLLGWSCTDGTCVRPPPPPAGPADQYLAGDWDGDGDDNLAIRIGDCVWMDVDEDALHDIRQCFGNPGDVYLVGDWDGDGRDGLGALRTECVYRSNDFDGAADGPAYCFGNPGDTWFAGDWDGDGDSDLGIFRPGRECIQMDTNGGGLAETEHCLGDPTDTFLTGNWDGDLDHEAAVIRGDHVLIDADRNGVAERDVPFGNPGDVYLVGDWDGDGDDNLAVVRRGDGCVPMDTNDVGGAAEITRCYGPGLR